MKEQLEQHVKRVKERYKACSGNEQQTKYSLIAPLFVILGYDTADPSECIPEYKADFGKGERASTPVDWMFLTNSTPAFIVEAKAADGELRKYAEQLGMYFSKAQPHLKLGVYTNGLNWQFYTDLETEHVMDKEPFLTWDVFQDEIPFDFLTLMQKAEFKAELIGTFAHKKRARNLLVGELNRLLVPSDEFTRLAIANIETRHLTQAVVDYWKPIVGSAIGEWANQRTLASVLDQSPSQNETKALNEPDGEHEHPHQQNGPKKKFWEALFRRPKVQATRYAHISPSESYWIVAGSGLWGVTFVYAIQREGGHVELYIDRGAERRAENKEIFDRIYKHKEEIEKSFGGELIWQRLDDKQGSWIGYATEGGYKSDESKWPAIQEAMIDKMIQLDKALTPHLQKLSTELAGA